MIFHHEKSKSTCINVCKVCVRVLKKKLKEECDCVFDALANQINYKNGEFHVLRNQPIRSIIKMANFTCRPF